MLIVEDQVASQALVVGGAKASRFTSRTRPIRLKGFRYDEAVRKDSPDCLPPAIDNTVWATDDGQLASDNAGSKDRCKRLPGPSPRPVADAFSVADSDGEVPLHEVWRCRFAIDLKRVRGWNGKIFCLPIFTEEPWSHLSCVPIPAESLGLHHSGCLILVGMFPELPKRRGKKKLDSLLICWTDDAKGDGFQNDFRFHDWKFVFFFLHLLFNKFISTVTRVIPNTGLFVDGSQGLERLGRVLNKFGYKRGVTLNEFFNLLFRKPTGRKRLYKAPCFSGAGKKAILLEEKI
jgi:hypothetical protein